MKKPDRLDYKSSHKRNRIVRREENAHVQCAHGLLFGPLVYSAPSSTLAELNGKIEIIAFKCNANETSVLGKGKNTERTITGDSVLGFRK